MSVPELSRANVGTMAKFVLTVEANSRQEVSKSIKAACSKNGSLCEVSGVSILVEQADGAWHPSSILTVTMIKRK